jgi:hypothetical protein
VNESEAARACVRDGFNMSNRDIRKSQGGCMRIFVPLLIVGLLFNGCASPAQKAGSSPIGQRLLGKSRTHILHCAGKPIQGSRHGEDVILRYYKEASMLEESRPLLKGSMPGVHHGCWASLLISNDEVTGVEFRTVPEGAESEDDECEAIFRRCVP